ncbi:unnamed protein product, partial [Nippostrongylus brasiliensis]|uniref:Uncharacterized protein n=1 Tax=Nippostrongylus brasiliensis TaxID=27835 RepID=A0A0N4XHS3_NIPBR
GCIAHQPRRHQHRARNFEDEPSNLRSRSFDQPTAASSRTLPFATAPPKPITRHSSTPARPATNTQKGIQLVEYT